MSEMSSNAVEVPAAAPAPWDPFQLMDRMDEEALRKGPAISEYAVATKVHRSSTMTGLTMKLPIDLDGSTVAPGLSEYSVELNTKILTRGPASYTYFDYARAVRE